MIFKSQNIVPFNSKFTCRDLKKKVSRNFILKEASVSACN